MDRSLDEIIAADTVSLAIMAPIPATMTDNALQLQSNKSRPPGGRRSQGRRRGDRDGVRKVLPELHPESLISVAFSRNSVADLLSLTLLLGPPSSSYLESFYAVTRYRSRSSESLGARQRAANICKRSRARYHLIWS